MKLDSHEFNNYTIANNFANKPTKSHNKIKKLIDSTMDEYAEKEKKLFRLCVIDISIAIIAVVLYILKIFNSSLDELLDGLQFLFLSLSIVYTYNSIRLVSVAHKIGMYKLFDEVLKEMEGKE